MTEQEQKAFTAMREALKLVHSKLSGNVNGADEHCFTISMKNQISYSQMCRISEALTAAKAVSEHVPEVGFGNIVGTHPQASEPAPAGWRPIESAPKDGTPILLFGDGRVTSGHWSAPSEIPRIVYQDGFAPEPEWDEWDPHWASWDGGFTEEHPATHWMPLPSPPKDDL